MAGDQFTTQFRLTQLSQEITFQRTPQRDSPPARGACVPTCAGGSGKMGTATFAATLQASLLEIRTQNFGAIVDLIGGANGTQGRGAHSAFDALPATRGVAGGPLGMLAGRGPIGALAAPVSVGALAAPGSPLAVSGFAPVGGIAGLSPTGRNLALFDPESAYRMMTLINRKEVEYQAELGRVGEMASHLGLLQAAGRQLGEIAPGADDTAIKAQLAAFVEQYNGWITRFDADLQPGGALAGTYAARVARVGLEQSIENRFFGAADGIRGMAELGIDIDPATRLASLDTARTDAALAANRDGAIRALQEFGTNFARSAELFASAGNFFDNRSRNLERVLAYLDAKLPALRAEFGLGDPVATTA